MVTYKGSGETIIAVAGGHVSASHVRIAGTQAFINAGKIRVLAVTSAAALQALADGPHNDRTGVSLGQHVFLGRPVGPPGMPANIVKILENAAKQVDAVPDVVEKLDKTGLEPFYLSGDAYRKFVFNEAITLKALKLR